MVKIVTFSGTSHQYLDSLSDWEVDNSFIYAKGATRRGGDLIVPKTDIKYIELSSL